jgi:arylsulfatase A-like enzyme
MQLARLISSCVAVAICCSCLAGTAAASQPKYNVVVILLDTLNADHMGTYGYSRDTTPFLSAFARESVLFEDDHAQGAYSLAAHYSLFTGTYAETHGIHYGSSMAAKVLDRGIPTLTERLRAAGFRTAWTGPQGLRHLDLERGLGRGFDFIRPITEWVEKDGDIERLGSLFHELSTRPFFAFVHTYRLHAPYRAVPPYDTMFDPGFKRHILSTEVELLGHKPTLDDWLTVQQKFMAQFDLSRPEDRNHFSAMYDAVIRQVDDRVKLVIDRIKSLGLYDKTIVVVTADHGEALGEHGYLGHNEPNREEVHTPLIMHVPGMAARRVTDSVLEIDVMPTILELEGLPIPASVEGRSLVPLIQGHQLEPRDTFFSHGHSRLAVWKGDWKLISGGGLEDDLYQIHNDPFEKHNLAREQLPMVANLRALLDAFLLKRARLDQAP